MSKCVQTSRERLAIASLIFYAWPDEQNQFFVLQFQIVFHRLFLWFKIVVWVGLRRPITSVCEKMSTYLCRYQVSRHCQTDFKSMKVWLSNMKCTFLSGNLSRSVFFHLDAIKTKLLITFFFFLMLCPFLHCSHKFFFFTKFSIHMRKVTIDWNEAVIKISGERFLFSFKVSSRYENIQTWKKSSYNISFSSVAVQRFVWK